MAMPAYPTRRPARTPLQRAARLANVWGWSYIITFIAIFMAPDTPAGPLRQCVVDLSVLFTIIGILELVWRRKLLKTGEVRWVKTLALNEVGGTLALLWNLWLIYRIPQDVLLQFMKSNISPETWKMLKNFSASTGNANALNDALIAQSAHFAQSAIVFVIGPICLLAQFWVIYRYLAIAREMENAPPAPPTPLNIPPILK